MARHLTADTLIASIKRRAMLPASQVTFKNEDFLAFANEEMDMAMMPYVMSFHEDYFLYTETIPIVNNKSRYAIPYRATGNKLRDVQFADEGGNLYEMARITVGDKPYYQYGPLSSVSARLKAFYIEHNEIALVPQIQGNLSGSLRVSYYIRPNSLVDASRIMTVQNINSTTGEITVNQVPSHISVNGLIDLIQVKSPHKCLAIDITVQNIDTVNKIITIAPASLPSELAIGDQLAAAEECYIPQIPTELHSMLAQRVACRCLEALGDQQGLQAAMLKLAEMEQKGGTLVDSRVDDAPLKVNNRHNFLRTSRRYVRR